MESKNIKIVDEHGIDRVANIVCSIDVDGSDYVIYWIERDNDNDNLFVSKLLKNNDGTSTMTNIEDSLEKSNLSDIVKELITHCINDEKDTIDTDSIVLKNGKTVKVANVLFNKEQNINVQKTYITTVKKSVTKVSEKYYHVESTPEVATEMVSVPTQEEKVVEVENVEMPVLDEVTTPVSEPKEEVPVLEVPVQLQSTPEVQAVETEEKAVEPVPVVAAPEIVIPETPEVVPTEVVVPAEPVVPGPELEVAPVVDVPSVDAKMNIIGANPTPEVTVTPEPVVNPLETINQPVAPVVPPVVPTVAPPMQNVSAPTPEMVQPATPAPNELFFDGSKETNLAGVFDGDDTKPVVATQTVEPIREFGQDEPVIPLVNDVQPMVQDQPKTLTRSPGFANNKFFMVIAITFFIASCVFLGYEVFKYFQMK